MLVGCVEPVDGPAESVDPQYGIVCGDGPTVAGMDVSYYEPSIDWAAAHAAGIDFTFVRVSDGLSFIDPMFPAYWNGARTAGVIRGAYQFFRPAEDPVAQADLLLAKMGPPAPGDLPPVIDVEVSGGLTTTEVAARVRTWVEHVTQALGRRPIVYAGLYSWHDLTGSADITTSPLWVAQYTAAPCPNIPVPWTRWSFWQHSSTGSVAGIPGSTLDLNVFNGTIDDLRGFATAVCGDGQCSPGETANSCPADCAPCGTIGADGGVIDDGDACFLAGGPAQYLRRVAGTGDGGDLIWTHATASPTEVNFAQWNLFFTEAGRYRVEAYTARAFATSRYAAYTVQAAGVPTVFKVDQTAADGWQVIGQLDFAAGGEQWIHLADNTGEPSATSSQLVFDAVRLTRIRNPLPIDDLPTTAHGGCAAGPDAGLGMLAIALAMASCRSRRAGRRNSLVCRCGLVIKPAGRSPEVHSLWC